MVNDLQLESKYLLKDLTIPLYLSRMFSYGEFKAEDQEQMLKALNKKVEEVYRNTIGDNEANIR